MHTKIITIFLLLPSVILLGMHISSAYAELPKYNIIMIEYSQSCKILLLHDKTTSCPSLQTLIPFDTSNQKLSGMFFSHNGTWYRTNPQLTNHYKFYSSTVVCVDCTFPGNIPDYFKTIWIEPVGFSWASTSETEHTAKIVVHSGSYVSLYCQEAGLAFDKVLLNKTITYMINNCNGVLPTINQTLTQKVPTPLDYKSNPTLIHKYWLDNIKKLGSLGNCITKKCNLPKDPFKNW